MEFNTKCLVPIHFKQNGVVERKHRHMGETGLAILFQSNVSIKYWVYTFLTATFLINRMPTKVLQMSTPFEIII